LNREIIRPKCGFSASSASEIDYDRIGSRVKPTRPQNQKLFLPALRTGRLANRLVLFANFIAFAEEHGHRIANVAFHSYAHLFETTRRDIYCRYPVSQRRSLFDLMPAIASAIRKTRIFYHATRVGAVINARYPLFGGKVATLCEIEGRDVTLLEAEEVRKQIAEARVFFAYGWRFRAPSAVEKHAEKIRAYFRPIDSVEQCSRETIAGLRRQADVVVGMHIRRGDYRGWKGGRFFYEVSRYAAWMREMAAQFPGRKVSFFVSSDEPRIQNEFEGLAVEIGSGHPVNDLYTLAKCDFIMGPPSTFSQWGSFHGGAPLLHLRKNDDRVELKKFRVSFFEEIP
jgi:hypothetical protein